MNTNPERREYRLTLNNVERGVAREERLVLSRHPLETLEHLALRLLTFALLWEERLTFGLGVNASDAPDLSTRDLTGRITTWVAVGDIDADLARKAVQHNRDAAIHVVFADPARRDAFTAKVASWGQQLPRGWEHLTTWTVEHALVTALATHEPLRQRWTVTAVGDHLYVEVDGHAYEGTVTRHAP
jgi:uncharacterized protein YaeQ